MNSKLFLFIFSLFAVSLYASPDTCYSLQFKSSYFPINVGSFPNGSRVLKIGRAYTVRYGCFNNFEYAKQELYRFKRRYPSAIIESTYKWRFGNNINNQNNRPILRDSQRQAVENKPMDISTRLPKQNSTINGYSSSNYYQRQPNYHQRQPNYRRSQSDYYRTQPRYTRTQSSSYRTRPRYPQSQPNFYRTRSSYPKTQFKYTQIQPKARNIERCYAIQLTLSKNRLFEEDFPVGTKIIKRGGFFSASYGCYDSINNAKRILNEIRKSKPEAIIASLPKSYFNQNDALPEIRKRGELLNNKNDYTNTTEERKNREVNFYKTNNNILDTRVKEPIKHSSSLEKSLIPCKTQTDTNRRGFAWENVNKNVVKQYVDHKLNNETNIQIAQPYNNGIAINNELNNTKQINKTVPSKGILNYYITSSLNINEGQTDNTGKHLSSQSLDISPGLTYLYNFTPLWYFYTNDRLILSIRKSGADLNFDVKEFYVKSRNLFNNYANFLIGRKYLKDDRGWYYKASLDTLGVSNKNDLLLYELYLGERLTKNNSSYDPNEVETNLKDAKFLFAHLSYQYFRDNTMEGFFIHEDNKNATKKLNWIGLRAQGKILQKNLNELSYWGDIATVDGDLNQSSISGLGFDIGAKYYFTDYFSAIAASFAYGSGGSNLFVQPSFTNDRSNYLSKDLSFRYYGEFLRPELSNIMISSLYFLHYFDTLKDETIILALHNYMQDKASVTQYSATNKTVNPNGKTRDIGNEIDLILHYDLFPGTYWRFSGGYFIGGSAFDAQTKNKDGFNAQVYFKYLW